MPGNATDHNEGQLLDLGEIGQPRDTVGAGILKPPGLRRLSHFGDRSPVRQVLQREVEANHPDAHAAVKTDQLRGNITVDLDQIDHILEEQRIDRGHRHAARHPVRIGNPSRHLHRPSPRHAANHRFRDEEIGAGLAQMHLDMFAIGQRCPVGIRSEMISDSPAQMIGE